MLLRCKFENPLFFTFIKDSRFYIAKAQKYPQKQIQISTRQCHELIDIFLEAANLIPSTLIAPGSIVYGKIGAIAFPSEFSIEIIF